MGTVTDGNGDFNIGVPDENAVLVISSVGFIPIQVAVKNNHNPEIRLAAATMQIKEVEVSTGYEQVAPERFIGSATVVDSIILERQVGRNLLTRLDGAANGLLFNKSDGAGVIKIQLRGVSTLNTANDLNGISSQNPLIILDDFPYTGDINSINPNTIASVSVLKDAVAASIWGARAGNGVIVIKTKTGVRNRPVAITFNSNISILQKPNPFYFPQMSSSDFIDVERDLFSRGFYDLHLQYPQFFVTSPVVEILDRHRKGDLTDAEANSQIDELRSFDIRKDVEKYIFRNAINKQNFLNVSGGSSLLGYNLSFGVDNNLSEYQGPGKNNRYNISTNFNIRPTKPLELNLGVDYNHEKLTGGGITFPVSSPGRLSLPYARLADEDGNHMALPTFFGSSYLESLPEDELLNWYYFPLDEREANAGHVTKSGLLRMKFGGDVRLTSWLSGSVKYQYTRQITDDRNLQDLNSFFTRDLINRYTNPTTFVRSIPLGGILDILANKLTTHNLRGQLNIQKNWQGVHDFTALVAGELSKSWLYTEGNRFYGYNDATLSYDNNLNYGSNVPQFLGGNARIPNMDRLSERNNNLVSFLANASYTYDSKYGIYVSGRRDGSNLFGVTTNNKYKPLWSVGGRWNISKENFYNVGWMPKLSIRATYGYAGNINNAISALSTILYSSRPNFLGQIYAMPLGAPNPDLRWEEVRTFNAAMDFQLFNNRVTGSIEWYHKQSKDVIANFPLDPTLGITGGMMQKNAANLTGKGVDLALQSKNIQGKFGWQTSLNVNFAKTIVSRYFEETKSVPTAPIIREGDIYMGIYAYRWAGLDPETGDPRGYIGDEISTNYQGIFLDSLKNQRYIGSAFPLLYGNLLNSFSYAGFSLSANISFRSKYYYKKPSIEYNQLYNTWRGHGDYSQRWQKTGDEHITNVPSISYPGNANRDKFYSMSEVNVEKGDHIRLQDIRLSYRWDNRKFNNLPIKGIELYTYIGNMNVMIWKASKVKYDPDYPTSVLPPVTSYSFGLNLTL
ncbi:SusC/RagA family TonB-linked outer membrane protein [Chitinophaga cymbidii]|uniref:SusC/RagA family TonB-linked outer membrane protein n=2 Tax=Chitinophaga cymbidii TaxID=1096750 RepID=A0A512RQ03_9BACT|nr:SusC/RagA family TonB-linked outer membrane protein [Chitinophaga cymbidii]